MRRFRGILLVVITGIAVIAAPAITAGHAHAQESLDRPLRVFLDCNSFRCDQDYFTEEVPWVDFVRDRQSADVHVLGTRQTTGAGGTAYTLEFRGRESFDGERLTLRETAPPDATESVRRSLLVAVVRLGLAPFARSTSVAPGVEVSDLESSGEEAMATPQEDPWNRWVFQLGVNGHSSGESQQKFLATSSSVNASRVTDDWKHQLSVRGSVMSNEFVLNDTTTFTSRRESYGAEGMAVKSLGSHWGAGTIAEWSRSTFNNYDHSVVLGAAAEYNLYPYSESNRRRATLLYAVGPRYNTYRETTLFGETAETLVEQMLVGSYDVTQPWGNVDVSARVNHYIAKFGEGEEWEDPQYNASLSGGFSVQPIKGLSARIRGTLSMVRGQIQLPAAGLTEEEILTQQRELATNYRYFMSFGLSYRFGSIFSSVVNPRFEGI